ncbi:MAG: DUF488 domain-containing protein [Methylacidiphilales bacterium]|nr:DUF488 domain-containing protein [Candidatus Methylacidiphilales bacterium]
MKIYTIGFTHKDARKFFNLIRNSGTKRLVDVRLNNVSQLAGFAKKQDLEFFLKELCGIDYVHVPDLAPTQALLKAYKNKEISWDEYEKRFLELMETRKIEDHVSKEIISDGCLLCSEDQPHHCHRRLVAEYLKYHWGDIEIVHLA